MKRGEIEKPQHATGSKKKAYSNGETAPKDLVAARLYQALVISALQHRRTLSELGYLSKTKKVLQQNLSLKKLNIYNNHNNRLIPKVIFRLRAKQSLLFCHYRRKFS